jgi:peptidoglycan/LPS O-acetylase OafA/YrhL
VSVWLLDERGVREFILQRTRRLGGPLLAGIVFVLPIVAAVWAWGWLESGRVTWPEVRSWRFTDVDIQSNAIGPAHLWFLQDLLIVSLLWSIWCRWRGSEATSRSRARLTLPGVLIVAIGLLAARPGILFHAPNTFVPDVFRMAFDATFFVGGTWFARHRDVMTRLPPPWLLMVLAALAAIVTTRLVSTAGDFSTGNLALASAATATAWLSIACGFKGLTALRRPLSKPAARLSADSYAVYVVHLPIVGAMQLVLAARGWPPEAKMVVVLAATVVCSLVLLGVARFVANSSNALRIRLHLIPGRAWIAGAIGLGVFLRLWHYVRNPDVWLDEAALLVNVVERSYASLLTPLLWHEAAPPLFLWAQRWLAVNVSDSTWGMRLLPFLAACATLIVFLPLTRLIDRKMVPVAVLLVASSVKFIDHAVEAKPYALDVLLATSAASAFVLTREWAPVWRALVFAAITPALVWISYPGVFIMAGVAAALAWELRRASARERLALGVLLLAIGISFLVLFVGPIQAQRSAAILENWRWAFPATLSPLVVTTWLARSLVGIADYCFRPFGGLLLIPVAFGLAAWREKRRHAELLLLILTLALSAVAGLLGQYPFSGTRVMVFALPALALLAAEGVGVILFRMPQEAAWLRATVMAAVIVPPLALCARQLVMPSSRPETAAASAFVLAVRDSTEPVAANSWEYRYYLRDLGASFIQLGEQPLPAAIDRVWCIVQGESPGMRRQHASQLAGSSYEVGREVDFHRVSVFDLHARR